MENPFQANNINTLREAFPNIEIRVIDDVLWSVHGDLNQAFEMLLSMSDNNATTRPAAPPLHHTLHHSTSMPFPVNNTTTTTTARTTPAKVNMSPKPLTVREELAQWRQDLREESRLRANRALNTRSSTSSLSLSNLLHSRNNSSSQVQQRENRYQTPLRERHSTQRLSVPTSLPNTNSSSVSSHNQNPTQSRATLFANNHPIRPGLPPRRTTTTTTTQSSSTASNNPFHSTNPFLSSSPPELNVQSSRSTSRTIPLPPLPPRRNSEEEQEQPYQPSFNPFEEENDIPPPAYSEIQRDIVIQAQGHTG